MYSAITSAIVRLAALAAITGALDITLHDGPCKQGVKILSGILTVMEIATTAFKITGLF